MFKNLWATLGVAALLAGCTPNHVKTDNELQKFFVENKASGCFALFNNASGKFTVYNLTRYRDSSYLPAASFNIVHALIGLQTGIISSDSMVIPWDGVQRSVSEWNKDLTMYEAFRVSSVPYFQGVARRLGKDTIQRWLDMLGYGTKKITTSADSFWLDNSLKITPDEQLGLVKKLYFDQLPFHKHNQETVKRAMLMEDNANYRLGYISARGSNEDGHHIGWMVGWIEENRHPYFFVLNTQSADSGIDLETMQLNMLKDILRYFGFLEGKM
jgi:beta-lactamase class D